MTPDDWSLTSVSEVCNTLIASATLKFPLLFKLYMLVCFHPPILFVACMQNLFAQLSVEQSERMFSTSQLAMSAGR